MFRTTLTCLLACLLVGSCSLGCGESSADPGEADSDPQDECATCIKKSDGFVAPEEGTCAALAMLEVANESSFETLDIEVGLDARAARNIVDARDASGPFTTLRALDDVPYVGMSAFTRIHDHAVAIGKVAACEAGASRELCIVSDLDDTVIPHASPEYSKPPYPGVPALYTILEYRNGGEAGDMNYVTARKPERVVEIPAYLEEHGVPLGIIETGVSGIPWIAEKEKTADIGRVLERHPAQMLVMFGDDTAADPEAYRNVLAAHPDLEAFGLIHEVKKASPDSRFEGLHRYQNYVEAAVILFVHGLIEESEVEVVRVAAEQAGLAVSADQIDAWIVAHTP
jgi:hypothetical protein